MAEVEAAILVVEDDATVRQTIAWILEAEGLTVTTAGSGEDALAWADGQRPALVLLDIGLPSINGQAVAAGLRERHGPGLPILAVTADGHAASKARQVGAYSYIQKPFEVDDLVRAVRAGLRRN